MKEGDIAALRRAEGDTGGTGPKNSKGPSKAITVSASDLRSVGSLENARRPDHDQDGLPSPMLLLWLLIGGLVGFALSVIVPWVVW